jgi:hypothetical protein
MTVVPVLVLAVLHKYSWGSSFGFSSGTWTVGSILALIAFVAFVVMVIHLGPNRIPKPFGQFTRRSGLQYLLMGVGLGSAMFPGAASSIFGTDAGMAALGTKAIYAFVGWALAAFAGFMFLLTVRGV